MGIAEESWARVLPHMEAAVSKAWTTGNAQDAGFYWAGCKIVVKPPARPYAPSQTPRTCFWLGAEGEP